MAWSVYADGSCAYGAILGGERHPARGWGGWAAVVERGSEGYVLRGNEENATAVRMELLAVQRALESIPDAASVFVVTDSTIIAIVRERWLLNRLPERGDCVRDQRRWLDLALQFDRLRVRVHLLGRSEKNPIHRRAHQIAQTEARKLRNAELGHPAPKERDQFHELPPKLERWFTTPRG